MFKLAIRMFRSDLRTILQGRVMTILFLFCVLLTLVAPVCIKSNNMAPCVYVFMMTGMWFSMRFTRVFHVAPFTISQIKRLILCGSFLRLLFFSVVGLIMMGISRIFQLDINVRFGLWYMMIYIGTFFSISMDGRLRGFYVNGTKAVVGIILFVIMFILSAFTAIGWSDKLSLSTEYLIQAGIVLTFYLMYVLIVFRGMDFGDFSQVKDRWTGREEFLE